MWECESCGCQRIAGDLTRCPMCQEDRGTPVVEQEPAGGFATGGPVTGGMPYLVGERGPEPIELPALGDAIQAPSQSEEDGDG